MELNQREPIYPPNEATKDDVRNYPNIPYNEYGYGRYPGYGSYPGYDRYPSYGRYPWYGYPWYAYPWYGHRGRRPWWYDNYPSYGYGRPYNVNEENLETDNEAETNIFGGHFGFPWFGYPIYGYPYYPFYPYYPYYPYYGAPYFRRHRRPFY